MAIGGVLFALLVLRPAVRARPALASPLGRSLAASAAGAAILGGAQLLALAVQLGALVGGGGWPVRELVASTYVRAAAARVLACAGLVVGCLRVRRAAGTGLGWVALLGWALALAMSTAWTSHAAARLGPRGLLLTLDGLHQVAAAAWIGGLGHLVLTALGRGVHAWPALLLKRFSALALTAVAVLVAGDRGDAGRRSRRPADRRGPRVVRVQPQRRRAVRARDGASRNPVRDRPSALGAPLAADLPGSRRLPADPQRPRRVAARAPGVLGEHGLPRGAAAPRVRPAGRRLRVLRVDGPHGSLALPARGARLSAPLRRRQRPPPHAFARWLEPQGRVPDGGDARAARPPRDARRLGPLARAPAALARGVGAPMALVRRARRGRRPAALLPGELICATSARSCSSWAWPCSPSSWRRTTRRRSSPRSSSSRGGSRSCSVSRSRSSWCSTRSGGSSRSCATASPSAPSSGSVSRGRPSTS